VRDVHRARQSALLANREWARLRTRSLQRASLRRRARSSARFDPSPATFGPRRRYVVPDVIVRKNRDRWAAIINPGSLPRVRLNRAYADAIQGAASEPSLARQLQEARGCCARSSSAPPSSASPRRSSRASAALRVRRVA